MLLRLCAIAFSGCWDSVIDINLSNFYIEQRYFRSRSGSLIVLPIKNEHVHV